MRHIIILVVLFIWFSNQSYSQIEVAEFQTVKESVEEKIPAPRYDSTENFIRYQDYYNRSEKKICKIEDYYSRYIGLQIYYPKYTDSYMKEESLFVKLPTYNSLSWSKVGGKYYTIIGVFPVFSKMADFKKIVNSDSQLSKFELDNPLFVIKDDSSGDTIYTLINVITPRFVLVPFYSKLRMTFKDKTFIAIKDGSIGQIPDGEKLFFVETGSKWKCIDVSLIRVASLFTMQETKEVDQGQDLLIVYLLKKDSCTIILQHDRSFGEDLSSFQLIDDYKKIQNNELKSKAKIIDEYIRKYGKEFGILISENKVKIGMSKIMCEESWGMPTNSRKSTSASGVSEIYRYSDRGTLIFFNDKLTNIIE